jgi:methyl acetate hydrolase
MSETLSRMRREMDRSLQAAVDLGHAPGVVAVAFDEREILYQGAFGRRGLGAAREMTIDTVFWYASMTKALVAAAAMLLVEQGRVDLDAPLGPMLPFLAQPQILEGFSPDGEPVTRAARAQITLRRLLTHTSGFGYDIWNADIGRYMQHKGLLTLAECKKASLMAPLTREPGESWQYGIGIDWAGQLIEALSGKSLGAYLHENLFEPLGMRDTGFGFGPDQRERLSDLHQRRKDGSLETIAHALTENPEFHMGGGGLYGVAPDYVAFLQMMLRGGRSAEGAPILAAATVAEMSRNNIGQMGAGVMKAVVREAANDSDFFPGAPQGWGLSFLINLEDSPHGRSAGSLSWAGLANSYYWIDPKRRVGGLVATQILPFADPCALSIYERFERMLYDAI